MRGYGKPLSYFVNSSMFGVMRMANKKPRWCPMFLVNIGHRGLLIFDKVSLCDARAAMPR
jgi:hypothetical protein